MALVVRAFPVRDRDGVNAFVRELGQRDTQAREFYCALGVRRESWFFQHADTRPIVIGVTEVREPLENRAAQYADADDGFSTWFKARIYALSGIDPDTTPLGPPTTMVHDSTGGRLPTQARLVVRAYPLRDRASLDEFVRELRERKHEARGFYERHRVEEAWFLQETDDGTIVIAVLATDDPERAARTYQESHEAFDEWFKRRVIEVSGVDPNQTPLGPPTEHIFEFTA